MADVHVVAIFMAYIGFNGVISSQFGNLSSSDPNLSILTTNGTTLQPGFYLFLAYTLLALFLTSFLTKKAGAVPQEKVPPSTEPMKTSQNKAVYP